MKLIFDINGAAVAGENRRPSDVINDLGIRWTYFEAQPADQCVFSYCSRVPADLPPFIRRSLDAPKPAEVQR
ncbi:hypothetical protein NKJ26_03130 [Mesorhizobium sp. M0152]|uniref:hypothetical protein n=1 Tax=Mesorhizobium sp. M0152 TaxID=2956898 RepID=UPI00333C64DC